MEGALLECPRAWERLAAAGYPPGRDGSGAGGTRLGSAGADGGRMRCSGSARKVQPDVAAAGKLGAALPPGLTAETVISYGLSARDSLTLSSLTEPVLCVQRRLPRPDGGRVEPQEFLLPVLPGPAEVLLPLLGVRLLQIPLDRDPFAW